MPGFVKIVKGQAQASSGDHLWGLGHAQHSHHAVTRWSDNCHANKNQFKNKKSKSKENEQVRCVNHNKL